MARAMARNSGLANLVSCRAPAAFALARRLQSTTTTQNFDGVAGENRSISRKQYEKWSRKHAEIMHIIDRQLEELNQSRDPITREYIREPHILMSGKKDYQEFVEAQEAERVAHPVQAALRELKEQQAQNAEGVYLAFLTHQYDGMERLIENVVVVADMTAKLHEMERQGQVKNSSQGPSNTARPTTAKTEPSVSRAPGDREKPKPSKLDRYEWMFTWTYTLVMLCFMYISWPESWTIEYDKTIPPSTQNNRSRTQTADAR